MPLSDVVRVSITRETTTPTQIGFGVPLISSFHEVFPELAREYTSAADMLTDGFTSSDPAYRAAVKVFSQNPRPTKVVVGREADVDKMIVKITPVAANLKATYAYTVTVNGSDATYTSDASPTVAEITAGLKSAIDALGEPVATTDNATDLDIESTSAGVLFSISMDRAILGQKNNTPDGDIVADLNAIRDENDDWYALILCNASQEIVELAAAYIEALVRIMVVSSADDDILGSGSSDLASTLQTAGYVRTLPMYSPLANTEYPCAGWVGRCLPYDPGSITWDLKTLAGISYTALTATEKTRLKGKNCNYYTRIAGMNVTQTGITPGNEWMDVINGIDWTQVRMQENIFGRLAGSKKVPVTDRGIGVIENEVRGVLLQGVANDVYTEDPAPEVSVPLAKDVSTADKRNRILTGVTFRATLAGAIHEAEVEGTVSV